MQCVTSSISKSNSYNSLIADTLTNYRLGFTKAIQTIPKSSEESYSLRLQEYIKSHLPLNDRLLIKKFNNARDRGFRSTRKEDFRTAQRAFAVARIPLQLAKLSTESSLLYESLLDQKEAYFHYCRGDFDQARKRTYEALANDLILEDQYGCDFLLIHRIQLVHNLARIDARCLDFNQAIKLTSQILSYLAQESETLPIPGLWDSERVKRQSPADVTAMFRQVTGEIALILTGKERQQASKLFSIITSSLNLQIDINRQCYPLAYKWLLIKQAFVNQDIPKFLELSSQFLAEGRGNNPLLWYTTVIDLVNICEEVNFTDLKLVKQEIGKDATTWKYFPQKLSFLVDFPAN